MSFSGHTLAVIWFLLLVSLCQYHSLHAQVQPVNKLRLDISSSAFALIPTGKFSSFFDARNGYGYQLKASLHFRENMGFVVTASQMHYGIDALGRAIKMFPDYKPTPPVTISNKIGGWVYERLMVGPVISFPYKKWKTIISVNAGIGLISTNSNNVLNSSDEGTNSYWMGPAYTNPGFCYEGTIEEQYKLNKNIAVSLFAGFNGFAIPIEYSSTVYINYARYHYYNEVQHNISYPDFKMTGLDAGLALHYTIDLRK